MEHITRTSNVSEGEVTSRRKRKLDKSTTYEDLVKDWTQCCYLLPKKHRLCNIARVAESLYCGNHRQMCEPAILTNAVGREGKRVPCPVDARHTIFEANLKAHMKICTTAKQKREIETRPYYSPNCNGGVALGDAEAEAGVDSGGEVDCAQLLRKIDAAFAQVKIDFIEDLRRDASVDERVRSVLGGEQTSFRRLRHVEQDLAIVQHLMHQKMLAVKDSNGGKRPIYVEFGAGKGLLTRSIHACDPEATYILVERSGGRRKADRFLREQDSDIHRIRMDIRHCFLPYIPSIQSKDTGNVVAVAKHLCGVASDLAIRSLSHLPCPPYSRGVAIATCCHHICVYEDYVGHSWLGSFGFSTQEFQVLRKWSGWAHLDRSTRNAISLSSCHTAAEEHDTPNNLLDMGSRPSFITEEMMPAVGKKVKRILDYGRVMYLREELHIDSKYVKYCDESLSPECMLILASDY